MLGKALEISDRGSLRERCGRTGCKLDLERWWLSHRPSHSSKRPLQSNLARGPL